MKPIERIIKDAEVRTIIMVSVVFNILTTVVMLIFLAIMYWGKT
jgi:hypothetical protein